EYFESIASRGEADEPGGALLVELHQALPEVGPGSASFPRVVFLVVADLIPYLLLDEEDPSLPRRRFLTVRQPELELQSLLEGELEAQRFTRRRYPEIGEHHSQVLGISVVRGE